MNPLPGPEDPGQDAPGRILVVHQGGLGDLILAYCALRDVLHANSLSRVVLACQACWMPLARDVFGFAGAHPVESAWFSSLFSRPNPLAGKLLSSLDFAILFSGSRDLAETFRKSGPPFLQVPPRPPANLRIHAAHFLQQELSARLPALPVLPASPPVLPALQPVLPALQPVIPAQAGIQPPPALPACRGPILLHPGAGSPRKRWPLSRFPELGGLLKKEGLDPVFVVGPAEASLAGELAGAGVDRASLVRPSGVGELVDLLRRAGGFVGNDSGAAHLSALLGVPTVTVFGPSDPARWSPQGCFSRAVRPETSCEPCFESQETACQDPVCLTRTLPEDVLDTLRTLKAP